MKNKILIITMILTVFTILGCSNKILDFSKEDLTTVNREIISINEASNSISINNKLGDGLVIIDNANFDVGVIELELKGENKPGKSFLGLAFNIQNDSTYEAIYFRPFNFQSDEKKRREHSVQYIYHPKNNWRFLRTNYEGQYEAEFLRQPSPDKWFGIRIEIESDKVYVYDKESNTNLLIVERLEQQVSNKIALWMGHNSKGEFRKLKLMQ